MITLYEMKVGNKKIKIFTDDDVPEGYWYFVPDEVAKAYTEKMLLQQIITRSGA